jgi:hypothetical protein
VKIPAETLKQKTILFKLIDVVAIGFHLLRELNSTSKGANHVGAKHVEPGAESYWRPRIVA